MKKKNSKKTVKKHVSNSVSVKPVTNESGSSKPLSKSKERAFQIIALLIPFIFFAILEIGLRIVGYGQSMPLFIENPSAPSYMLPRPDVVKRYFPKGKDAPTVTIEVNFFKKEKPADGIRIFVQGGSTAAGYPYGLGASIAGMLDYRMKQSFPDRPVEVISTAMSAVNSYTLLDFADEIIEQSPDAVVVYAGHNEYLGLLGVGSSYSFIDSRGITLLFLRLKEWRTFQLMQAMLWRGANADDKKQKNARTFMAKVAKNKNIPLDSVIYERGQAQFKGNMQALISKYQAAGIPVFISTIASNLRDHAPFASAPVSESDVAEFRKKLRDISFENTDAVLSEATPEVNALMAISEQHTSGEMYFELGKALYDQGQFKLARNAYVMAREHDLLRFRAPLDTNNVIRELAKQEGVTLVEASEQLDSAAKNGVIGFDLMLEHLHPNVQGYFEISDAFYHALRKSKLFGNFPKTIPTEQARKEIPVLDAEEYYGRAKIAELVSDYPFSNQPKRVLLPRASTWSEQLGKEYFHDRVGWIQVAHETYKRSKGNPINESKAAKLIADAIPNESRASHQAGVSLMKAGRADEAVRYFTRAVEFDVKNVEYHLSLIRAYLKQNKMKGAQSALAKAQEALPDNIKLRNIARQVGRSS